MTYMFFLIHLETCGYFGISAHVGLGKDGWVYDGTGTAYVLALSSSDISFNKLFLLRNAMPSRGVCLSVRPSVRYLCILSKRINMSSIFSPFDSHIILGFPHQTLWQYSDWNPPNGGIECRWRGRKSRFWTNSWFSDWWLVECDQQFDGWPCSSRQHLTDDAYDVTHKAITFLGTCSAPAVLGGVDCLFVWTKCCID